MIDYKDFSFASAPRSGSTWFMQAAANAGLGIGHKATVHLPDTRTDIYKISMVRHPCDWLASYFNVIKGAILGVPSVDRFAKLSSDWVYFDHFIDNYLNHASGCVGQMFLSYSAHTYLRIEDAPHCFFDLCDTFNITKPVMPDIVNSKTRNFVWDSKQYEQVIEAELSFIEQFDYDVSYSGARR